MQPRRLVLTISLLAWIFVVIGFRTTIPLRLSNRLWKGKLPEEAGLSKKQLFRQVRKKIEEASKRPGFFDPPEGLPEMELFCAAGADGRSIADCPDVQFVQMVLLKKGVFFETRSVRLEGWQSPMQNFPYLRHHNDNISGALLMAKHVERCYPHKSLLKLGKYTCDEALEIVEPFFGRVVKLISEIDSQGVGAKNGFDLSPQNRQRFAAFLGELEILDMFLRSSPGQYLCGLDMTLADLYLAPRLFRALIAAEHFFQKALPVSMHTRPHAPGSVSSDRTHRPLGTLSSLELYANHMFSKDIFQDRRAYCDVDKIIHGWKKRIQKHRDDACAEVLLEGVAKIQTPSDAQKQ